MHRFTWLQNKKSYILTSSMIPSLLRLSICLPTVRPEIIESGARTSRISSFRLGRKYWEIPSALGWDNRPYMERQLQLPSEILNYFGPHEGPIHLFNSAESAVPKPSTAIIIPHSGRDLAPSESGGPANPGNLYIGSKKYKKTSNIHHPGHCRGSKGE